MSAATITPYRSDLPARPDGFAQLLHAEWTKFRTVRGWVIGMIVAAVVMDLVGLFAAGNSSGSCSNGPGTPTLSGRSCREPRACTTLPSWCPTDESSRA